ncbi:MAG: hypothetical protein KAH56_04110 [Candidatus Krumholzibacteria bacterium]|nr:hypothetical protein [Candidatus Krumholzibacteria bacterium]
MGKRGYVVLGLILTLASVFLVEKALTPQPAMLKGIPPVEPEGFLSPEWVAADGNGARVFLHWRSVPGALAYTLWRSGDPDRGYRVIHMSSDTTYTDRNGLISGEHYFYQLTATDSEFGESGFSETKCVELAGSRN